MLKFFSDLSGEPASAGDQLFRLPVQGLAARAIRQAPSPDTAGKILNTLQADPIPLSI
jgi:hypothetical protein